MKAGIHSYPYVIKEIYLDTFGHMNNAAYLTLYEEARWDLITTRGYGLEKIRSSRLGPTILEITLRFMKELKVRDEIVIETKLLSYEKKIGKLQQQMLKSGEVCCEAVFTIALFDLQQRKLVLPTQDWLHAIGVSN